MSNFLDTAGDAVVIQGATGRVGRRHLARMRAYGTTVVGGVSPGHGGSEVDGVPIFDSVATAVERTGATTSVAFLPPDTARDGLIEAADAGISLCVSVTEGVPRQDLLEVLEAARSTGMRLVGPNSPGLLSQGRYLLGFLPVSSVTPGPCAVVSRSGTLSYEVVHALGQHGLGVSTWIGIGGDRVKGTSFTELLPMVRLDARNKVIVLVGEIGGTDEEDFAAALAEAPAPVVALLAGRSAPEGVALGHAGAIVEAGAGGFAGKKACLEKAGVTVVDRPSTVVRAVQEKLERTQP
ncbi:succinate--CoA ligase subunit alpha [Amycolatopsis jejuensis]|uniref:succinate--CoA ligase subunit alpha n=1 Tax=Amycolatopsis jejuensis TaxID=330084 RepID=UPI000525308C|nr:CoA-binding protein [Amycolatopsis jejuensis]